MAARQNFELACLQFQYNRAGCPRFLARSRPEFFCQSPDHRFGFGQENIPLKRILDGDRFRGAVRNNFVFVDAPRQFVQANAIAPEAPFECGPIQPP